MSAPVSIATWNINSVRLRLDLVLRFLEEAKPDLLCLQETKCPDAEFPSARLVAAGYPFIITNGMKGYNGVAMIARRPIAEMGRRNLTGREDSRHLAVALGEGAAQLIVENYYVPAGGDVPDAEANPKFAHKLGVLDEMIASSSAERAARQRHVLVGDLNVAPLECDVWNHKALLDVVSHTPVETERLARLLDRGGWVDAVRQHIPEPERLYSWWSYRSPDWEKADKGRRLDHVWVSDDLAADVAGARIEKATRGWDRPSDHVPVVVTLAG